ncbi:TCTE1 family protein [Megaselia abdita]
MDSFVTAKIPCSVDINVFKAYFDVEKLRSTSFPPNRLNAFDLWFDRNSPKTLRHLILDKLAEQWDVSPIYEELPSKADKNYILDKINMNIPINILCCHIKEDFFWRKCYMYRWRGKYPASTENRKWISIYMEKHLQDHLQNLSPQEYEEESTQNILDIVSPFVVDMVIDYLQPSIDIDHYDHIPLNQVLSNLPNLKTLRITFSTKTAKTNFFLNCNKMSRNDIISFSRGLRKCYELEELYLHSVPLEPFMLLYLAKSLDTGCTNIKKLTIAHCLIGDLGIYEFLNGCSKESFPKLKILDLTNNMISPSGTYALAKSLVGRSLMELSLRLNPIESGGTAPIISAVQLMPNLESLNLSGCSLNDDIVKMLLKMIIENKTLTSLNLSNNDFTKDTGKNIYRVIGFNKTLKKIDLRNTGATLDIKNRIDDILSKN